MKATRLTAVDLALYGLMALAAVMLMALGILAYRNPWVSLALLSTSFLCG